MTDLTDKWKKGELPDGFYYVKDGESIIAEYLDGYFYNNGEPMTSFSGGVDKVLAKVPTYEEYQNLKEYEQTILSYSMKPIDYDLSCRVVTRLLDEKKELRNENTKLKTDCKTLAQTLLKVSPEHKAWLEKNYKEYL